MRPPKVELEITRGRAVERVRPVDKSAYLIGSADDCDLVLAAPQIPEVHAYLLRHNDGVSLRYLGAKPPLTVNGRLVRSDQLADGDCICTGPYELVVHIEPSEPAGDGQASHFTRLSADLSESAAQGATAMPTAEALSLVRDIRASLPTTARPRIFVAGEADTRRVSRAV